MTTFKTLLTAAALAAVIIAAAPGIINASNRRAEYLEAESAVWSFNTCKNILIYRCTANRTI